MTQALVIPTVAPKGPHLAWPLAALYDIAWNVAWSWDVEAQALFERLFAEHWHEERNPVRLLREHPQLDACVEDRETLALLERVHARFVAAYGQRQQATIGRRAVAYFSAEYGLCDALPLYAGGLGILAGDHLKSASDQGIDLVAVGLFYRHGYFRQLIDARGRQEHAYPTLKPGFLPMLRVATPSGEPLSVPVELPGRTLHCAVRLVRVGRVPLLLLDPGIDANAPSDRAIASLLYVGDRETRLLQELVLGVGGVRVLRALGVDPSVFHLNEGHSAFLLLERVAEELARGQRIDAAMAAVQRTSVFTIHTPVPAGNERFEVPLVRESLAPLFELSGIAPEPIIELGRGADGDPRIFDMTALCLRLSRRANGVSRLHGETATSTWQPIIGRPVAHVTNGVHRDTWVGAPLRALLVEVDALADRTEEGIAKRLASISDERLWEAHLAQKRALDVLLKRRVLDRLRRLGAPPRRLRAVERALGAEALVIGFARRFATYKRAYLLFRHLGRLSALVGSERPVRVIFAGKAHPLDEPGQRVLADVVARSDDPAFAGRVVFLEGYDMEAGARLTQGVDVWLNTPRRPLEASGTSGMKAAQNGVPNLSVLDGWWDEGFTGGNGWAIGGREPGPGSDDAQDDRDADTLYRLLETEVVPRYFDRAEGRPSAAWLATMRQAIASSLWRFSAARMVEDYASSSYLRPAPSA